MFFKVALNLPSNVESFSYDFRDLLHNQASQTNLPFIFPDEGKDENIFLMQSPTEEIVLSARKTLEYLEKESERINKKYLQYKMKYKSILVSASESSICSSSDAEMRDVETMLCSESPVLVLKLGKSAQTGQENTTHEVKGLEENGKVDSDIEYNIKRYTEENFPTFSIKGTSTKRQLQNREYFLKSRKLLEEIEKQNEENLQKTSILNSPLQNSISSSTERFIRSSDETEKEKTKNIFEKPVAHNSLNNSLFYGRNAVLQSEEKLLPESNGTDIRSLEARADLGCLELLSKSEVKSEEVIPSRNMLRQQILFASTNDDEEPESKSKQINKGVKIIKSPVLGLPSPNFSASSENASMGRDSPGGDF